jgi:aconitate decarboxylase
MTTQEQVATTVGPSARLADLVARLRLADLPAAVVRHAKLCLLDTVGCGLFGSTLEWSRILRDTLAELDGGNDVAVWGTGLRLSANHAALANGAAVHAFELDDLHRAAILHPGSVVLPTVLSAARLAGGSDGATALAAYVAGYEVGARVGASVGAAHLLQGWHPTGTHGAFAAAAAASVVFGLDSAGAGAALGIAGSQAAGLMAAQYSAMVKRFHAGHAAQSGLYAAALAKNGYTGTRRVLEEPYGGYWSTVSPTCDESIATAGLGERWETAGIVFKFHAANGSCHPTIDILQRLRREHGFAAGDVARVRVRVSSATVAHVGWPYEPDSVTTAQMNLSYIVAVVLAEGEASVAQFRAELLADPDILALTRRVEVTADPDIDALGDAGRHLTRIEITLACGTTLTAERPTAAAPGSADELETAVRAKFRTLAGHAVDQGRVAAIEAAVDRFDDLTDVESFERLLVG